jgi:hypothetical protein
MTTPPTDAELLAAIMDAVDDPWTFVNAVHAFYADRDRADRTSREQLYLHLGMACGMIMRGQEPRP